MSRHRIHFVHLEHILGISVEGQGPESREIALDSFHELQRKLPAAQGGLRATPTFHLLLVQCQQNLPENHSRCL